MSGAKVIYRGQRFSIGFIGCLVCLFGCTENETPSQSGIDAGPSEAVAAIKIDRKNKKTKRGQFQLGQDEFELGVVICFGTSTATAIASDSQKRSDYPVVTLKTYDPAMTGGQSFNTASALFERDGYGEHWKLHEGSVEKDGDVFTASGTLEGNLLLPKPDGTRESAPLDGDDVLPFEVRIEC